MHAHISFIIRQMHKEDLAFAAQCTAGEGWVSESLPILESFFLKYPQGCLLAEENGRSLGICIVTPYGSSGFVGELIVRPEARGRGIGAQYRNFIRLNAARWSYQTDRLRFGGQASLVDDRLE